MSLGMTIHILRAGLPLCGFTTEVPGYWPRGHLWCDESEAENTVRRGAPENISCEICRERFMELRREMAHSNR